MEISLCTKKLDAIPEVQWGLRDLLVRKSRKGAKLRKDKFFACRHCLPSSFDDQGDDTQGREEMGETQRTTRTRNGKKFDFDGVRSHLKSRFEFTIFRYPFYVLTMMLQPWRKEHRR